MKRRARKLRYGKSRHQVGVYRAAEQRGDDHPAAPTIVLLHGGSWSWPYNRWVMWPLALDAARRGWGVFNVDYRRVGHLGGGGGWPETFDDARTAIELITNDTSKLGIDVDRVVVVGHSAGGHLALIGAATADISPALVVSMSGPTDLERLWSNGSQPVRDLTARAPESSRWSITSPIHMLPLGVPTLCVHGEADTTVHPRHSTEFVEAARSAGDVAEAVLVPGETHKDALKPTSEIWVTVTDAISERLESHLQV
jgi:acetyl esterase/lipase